MNLNTYIETMNAVLITVLVIALVAYTVVTILVTRAKRHAAAEAHVVLSPFRSFTIKGYSPKETERLNVAIRKAIDTTNKENQ